MNELQSFMAETRLAVVSGRSSGIATRALSIALCVRDCYQVSVTEEYKTEK